MAIKNVKEKTSLKLQLDGGIVGEKQKFISKTFSNIKTDALDGAVYDTAKALEGLQSKTLLNVIKVEEVSLIDE